MLAKGNVRTESRRRQTRTRIGSSPTSGGPTEVVFHIETTEPGTPLDDLLRAKPTEVLLELLSEARKEGDLPEH
jgi:hypothetical protein